MHTHIPPRASTFVALGLTAILGGCIAAPAGALLQVLPGATKSLTAGQDDQTVCKQLAQQSVSGQVDNTNLRTFGTAALGTGLGTAIGGGQGAGIAGAPGAYASSKDQGTVQPQYDNAYAQCMSTKGNAVPGAPALAPPPARQPQATTAPDQAAAARL